MIQFMYAGCHHELEARERQWDRILDIKILGENEGVMVETLRRSVQDQDAIIIEGFMITVVKNGVEISQHKAVVRHSWRIMYMITEDLQPELFKVVDDISNWVKGTWQGPEVEFSKVPSLHISAENWIVIYL